MLLGSFQCSNGLLNCLQICAAFRGTYLDTKDKAEAINKFNLDEQADLRLEFYQVWLALLHAVIVLDN